MNKIHIVSRQLPNGEAAIQGTEPISKEAAEESNFVICGYAWEPVSFSDIVFDECSDCRSPIRYREVSPKKPPKICRKCADLRMGNQTGKT